MAIVIPSKNIYSIKFDPAIDNQIDKVEVSVNAFKEVKDFDTIIYSENYTDFNSANNQGFSDKAYKQYFWAGGVNTPRNVRVATEIKGLQKTIIFPKIYIPKNQNKKLITNTREAKISVSGEINHYTSGISFNAIYGDLSFGFDSVSSWVLQSKESSYDLFNAENYNNEESSVLYERDVASVLQNELEEIQAIGEDTRITANHRLLKHHTNGVITIFSNININNNGHAVPDPVSAEVRSLVSGTKKNISITIETHNGEEYYAIKIEPLLIELTVMFATGAINWYSGIENSSIGTYIRNGATKIEFIPNKIDLSVYGDIITLDLQDETVTINNGNKVFSFDGNELIQTTNTPTQRSKYQGVIDKWKNGKQTAVIACPITDFYDTNGNKVIDTSVSGKMLFDIGDIVIPYSYTNKGDKPLSYNKNLSPKQFKVVGTKISKNQGGTQESTVQEFNKEK